MQDIEREGRKVVSQRDPPGQRSVYIPPGTPNNHADKMLLPNLYTLVCFLVGSTKILRIIIHNFPAGRSAMKGTV